MPNIPDDLSFPGRPDHPDFWKLSEIVLQMDGATEASKFDLLSAISSDVDPESLMWMASQRAYRVTGCETAGQVLARLNEIAAFTAVWVEAFLVGVRYTESSLPEDPEVEALRDVLQFADGHASQTGYRLANLYAADSPMQDVLKRAGCHPRST